MNKKILIIIIILIVLILGIGGYLLWSQYLSKESSSSDKQQERKFIALGSSISTAESLSSQEIGGNLDFSFSTGTEIESLYKYLKDQGQNLTPVNLASSGATTEEILEVQVPNVKDFHPKYITLDPGADLVLDIPLEQYQTNLSKIIKEINNDDAIIIIATYPNFSIMRTANLSACQENKLDINLENLTKNNIETFNNAIKEIANQNNLILADLYNLLGPDDVSDYDCLHPNIEGQKKIAQKFIEALSR